MESVKPPRLSRSIGESQGYRPLHISDRTYNCNVNGPDTPMMVTHWRPSPKELEALVQGAVIELSITGNQHPPLLLAVWPSEHS
jgi:hypothetical protein